MTEPNNHPAKHIERSESMSIRKGRFEIKEENQDQQQQSLKSSAIPMKKSARFQEEQVAESAPTVGNVMSDSDKGAVRGRSTTQFEMKKRHSGRFSITETFDLPNQSLSLQTNDSEITVKLVENDKFTLTQHGRFEVLEKGISTESLDQDAANGKKKVLKSRVNQEDPAKIISQLERARDITDEELKSVVSQLSTSALLVSLFR
jgi:hypothetical protein